MKKKGRKYKHRIRNLQPVAEKKKYVLFYVVSFILVIRFLYYGLFKFILLYNFGESVNGIVVNKFSGIKSTRYSEYSFVLNSKTYTHRSANIKNKDIGDTITIKFLPACPDVNEYQPHVDSFFW
jgi:hypothetical protein